jgi:hypothetical protein
VVTTIKVPHLNHVRLVAILTMLPLLQMQTLIPPIDNFLPLSKLDRGILLVRLQHIPLLLPPRVRRTGPGRKVVDDLASALDSPNPNPPSQQLHIHPEKTKAKLSSLTTKGMT